MTPTDGAEATRTVCAPTLFDANDISLQPVEDNGIFDLQTDKTGDWALVINLDLKSKNGFLQSQFMHCDTLKFIPKAEMHIEVFDDKESCCLGERDVRKCHECDLVRLDNDYTKKALAIKLEVIGNRFSW